MKEETIAYGLICDCGCDAPMTREIEGEPVHYALLKDEEDAKKVADSIGAKVGKFIITVAK